MDLRYTILQSKTACTIRCNTLKFDSWCWEEKIWWVLCDDCSQNSSYIKVKFFCKFLRQNDGRRNESNNSTDTLTKQKLNF